MEFGRRAEIMVAPWFTERTGLTLNVVEQALNKAESKGLIYRDFKTIRPTELGQRFLNDLQQIFLPD